MRKHAYLTITEDEWKELDEALKISGFKTRTEYFTAAALITIYGENAVEWCKRIKNLLNTKRVNEQNFFRLLDELALPVIAMRGGKTVGKTLGNELQQRMFEGFGTVPTIDEINRLIHIYELINKPKLEEYRTNLHTERYAEAHTEELL